MSARIDGVDLSHYQGGALDFAKAQRAGVRFVFHKATEGTGYRDPMHNRRRAEVGKVGGLRFGAYHFARPGSGNPIVEALHFLSAASPRPGDMRPMLDLEDRGGLSRTQLTAWVRMFVREVEKATGEVPFIYTPFDLDDHFDCPLWVARYSDAMSQPHTPAPWKRHTIWQFSDGQFGHPSTVPGIGRCDINTMNGDPAQLVDVFTLGAERRVEVPAKNAAPKETDMPYSDWPKADREALANDVAEAITRRRLPNQEDAPKGRYVGATLTGIYNMLRDVHAAVVKPGK